MMKKKIHVQKCVVFPFKVNMQSTAGEPCSGSSYFSPFLLGKDSKQPVQLPFLNNKEHQILALGGLSPFLDALAYIYWLQEVLALPGLTLAKQVYALS